MDILFYDWHYFGVYLQTPMMPTDTHSRVIGITIPQSTYVVRTGFEPVAVMLLYRGTTLPIELPDYFIISSVE